MMTSGDFSLSTSAIIVPKSDSEGPCDEFILFSDLQQQAKVISTEFKLEFHSIPSSLTQRKTG